MEKITTHPGIVTSVIPGHVSVQMHVVSACASCEAHSKCGFAEAKDKTVEIDTRDWADYTIGDNVTVVISTGNGLRAVLIAYVLPAIILLGGFITCYCLNISEGITALVSLTTVVVYGFVLFACRHRLQQKFSFQIKK